jgi:hypothetical protein
MTRIPTKQLTAAAIMLAVTVALQFAAAMLPLSDLTVMAVCGAVLYMAAVYIGLPAGVMLYVAAVLLGLLIVPNRFALLPYLFCFGPYAILKIPVERLCNRNNYKLDRQPVSDRDFPYRVDTQIKRAKSKPSLILEYLLKLILFSVLTGAAFFIFGSAFFDISTLPKGFPLPLFGVAAAVMFLVYDRILTLVGIISQRYFGKWRS